MNAITALPPIGWKRTLHGRLLALSALFWLFTYVLMTIRSGFQPDAVPLLITGKRVVAVTFGAGIYLAASLFLVRRAAIPGRQAGIVFLTVLISAVAAFIIRLGLDQNAFGDSLPVTYTVRWTLVWTGYFGLCLFATLWHFETLRTDSKAFNRPMPAPQPRMVIRAAPAVRAHAGVARPAEAIAWEWLLDVIAEEMAEMDSGQLHALASRLANRSGYEIVDPLLPSEEQHNARVKLADSIASRLKRRLH